MPKERRRGKMGGISRLDFEKFAKNQTRYILPKIEVDGYLGQNKSEEFKFIIQLVSTKLCNNYQFFFLIDQKLIIVKLES